MGHSKRREPRNKWNIHSANILNKFSSVVSMQLDVEAVKLTWYIRALFAIPAVPLFEWMGIINR